MAKIPRADQSVMQRGGKKAARGKSSKVAQRSPRGHSKVWQRPDLAMVPVLALVLVLLLALTLALALALTLALILRGQNLQRPQGPQPH